MYRKHPKCGGFHNVKRTGKHDSHWLPLREHVQETPIFEGTKHGFLLDLPFHLWFHLVSSISNRTKLPHSTTTPFSQPPALEFQYLPYVFIPATGHTCSRDVCSFSTGKWAIYIPVAVYTQSGYWSFHLWFPTEYPPDIQHSHRTWSFVGAFVII